MNSAPARILVEACVGSLADALVAASLGADRIEFCSGLEVGGLTPNFDDLRRLHDAVATPIVVMIRPREGDFCYSTAEWKGMLSDAESVLSQGADGMVFGALTEGRTVDAARVAEMAAVVRSYHRKEIVFHRAFDEAQDLEETFGVLEDLDVDRILTSGGASTATEGTAVLRKLVSASVAARGKPAIIAGGGVRAKNVVELLHRTGVGQVHAACGTGGSPSKLDPEQLRRLLAVVRAFERSSDRWWNEPEN